MSRAGTHEGTLDDISDPAELRASIRDLRRECAARRIQIRAYREELARLQGYESAFRELAQSLGSRLAQS